MLYTNTLSYNDTGEQAPPRSPPSHSHVLLSPLTWLLLLTEGDPSHNLRPPSVKVSPSTLSSACSLQNVNIDFLQHHVTAQDIEGLRQHDSLLLFWKL